MLFGHGKKKISNKREYNFFFLQSFLEEMTEEKKSEKYKHYYKWKVSFNLFLLHLHKPLSEFNILFCHVWIKNLKKTYKEWN